MLQGRLYALVMSVSDSCRKCRDKAEKSPHGGIPLAGFGFYTFGFLNPKLISFISNLICNISLSHGVGSRRQTRIKSSAFSKSSL